MTTPVAFIVGLNRTDGRVCAVRVRCPWCGRIHIHRWPIRDAPKPPCGTPAGYHITFHTP